MAEEVVSRRRTWRWTKWGLILWTFAFLLVRQRADGYSFSSSFVGFGGRPVIVAVPKQQQRQTSRVVGIAHLTMKIRVGILGLPNIGKSSLFNALARQSLAQAANFPFCTIDPTSCLVPCPDPYLDRLTRWSPPYSNRQQKPATMEWVDVAGLAKNAHRGEGLGNQFLGTLRDCTCLCHVVRAFEDPTVLVHQGGVEEENNNPDDPKSKSRRDLLCDPLRDLETIQLELLLADLAHVQRRLERIKDDSRPNTDDSSKDDERLVLERVEETLQGGIPARALPMSVEEQRLVKSMGLLTLKPVVYAFNVDEVDFFLNRQEAEARAQQIVHEFESSLLSSLSDRVSPAPPITDAYPYWTLVCANVESTLAQCTPQEREKYLESIGVSSPSESDDDGDAITPFCYDVLPTLVRRLLGYAIVYTGPGVPLERSQTTRAHLVYQSPSPSSYSSSFDSTSGVTAYDLAGRIHGDIQKGFLRAQVVQASVLLEHATDFARAKELGLLRAEGKDYVLQNEDVVLVQWKG